MQATVDQNYSDRQNKANYNYISNNKYAIKIYDVKISSYNVKPVDTD